MKPETIIEHEVNGVWFKARADLAGGVAVSGHLSVWLHVECMAFGAWHAMEIRPQLASFAGYDSVRFK